MIDYLSGLNEQQKAAVLCEDPCYIIAGAGTGKTKTLTTKIAYLIDKKGVLPNRVLALTFTNNAANEMRERIGKILGSELKPKWCSTFHSFALRILRQYIEEIPELCYKKDFLIIDEQDVGTIISQIKKQINVDLKLGKDKIIECIYSLKYFNLINFVSDQDQKNAVAYIEVWLRENHLDDFGNKEHLALFSIFTKYFAHIKQNNLLYFDDLQLYLYQLLRDNSAVSKTLNSKFDYVLVDEFQDTDYIQFEILKLLRKDNHQVFVVGDPDQSIYGFRGARYQNNSDFLTYFNAKELFLSENYRSCQPILDAANQLIKYNILSNNPEKKLFSATDKPGSIYFRQYDSDLSETNAIVNIIKIGKSEGKKYSDFAVLFRASYSSRLVESTFIKEGIPYIVWGSVSFFERTEIKDTIAFLSLVFRVRDNLIFFQRIANKPSRGFGEVAINKFAEMYSQSTEKLGYAPDTIAFALAFGKTENKKNFQEYAENFYRFRKIASEKTKIADVIELFLDEKEGADYKNYLKKQENYADRLQNVNELKSFFLSYEKENPMLTKTELIVKAMEDIALAKVVRENRESVDDMVVLANIHKVKGLEFNTVFLYGLNDKIFPSSGVLERDSMQEIEEERRVYYVAITRAKENLYVSCAKKRAVFGRFSDDYFPSIFFEEMGGNISKTIGKSEYISNYFKKDEKINYGYQERIKYKNTQENKTIVLNNKNLAQSGSLVMGDKVSHPSFGAGVVIAVKPKFVIVDFGDSQKCLSAVFLTKIG